MRTKDKRYFSVARTTARDDGTPFDATEVFVYLDIESDIVREFQRLLDELGFCCMDAEYGETVTFNGRPCSYWAIYDGD